ncbi:MAG: LamG domain-containing protein [Propionibacteriaceae bacterium]|nr:LamG domain-containing protein [Propionibacteriaceae bacterium]
MKVELEGGPLQSNELRIEFAGEWYAPTVEEQFVIGREGDLVIDDNPYLHRKFLRLAYGNGLWWVINDGSRLAATLSDGEGRMQSWLSPGSAVPLVFAHMCLTFSAGSTTYEVNLFTSAPAFAATKSFLSSDPGEKTIGAVPLTPSQKLLLLALCETRLRRLGSGAVEVPSSAEAAARLGWSQSRFTRKLDNVCDKFDRIGVEGLRGGASGYAVNRRVRLVEYAVTSLVVTQDDLPLLDAEAAANRGEGGTPADD